MCVWDCAGAKLTGAGVVSETRAYSDAERATDIGISDNSEVVVTRRTVVSK